MKILVVFAHPRLETSVVQRRLLDAIRGMAGVTVHDLYFAYPDFHIDIEAEKLLLMQHDMIVLQHPFYWYSVPAIIKEWLDLVLEFNWAYGPEGDALHGKFLMSVLSTGGDEHAYHAKGRNRFPIYSGRRMNSLELAQKVQDYRSILAGLHDGSLHPLDLLAPGYIMPAAQRTG
jgi:glutathione-regulated potassium-efflux system ancillary protein KefG